MFFAIGKILWSSFQIIASIEVTTRAVFMVRHRLRLMLRLLTREPCVVRTQAPFKGMLALASVTNLSLGPDSYILPMGCLVPGYDFINSLYAMTLGPMLVGAAIYGVGVLRAQLQVRQC